MKEFEPRRHQGHQATSAAVEPIPAGLDRIAAQVVDGCFRVHSKLGAGLLESVYKLCLAHELRKRGLKVEIEVPVPVVYDEIVIDTGFRIDLLVEDSIIVEVKATIDDHPIFKAQILTHMKLLAKRLGFLVNFNKKLIKDGIQCIAL
jgi:GxxExxY protein